jgi:hypothetical protein
LGATSACSARLALARRLLTTRARIQRLTLVCAVRHAAACNPPEAGRPSWTKIKLGRERFGLGVRTCG